MPRPFVFLAPLLCVLAMNTADAQSGPSPKMRLAHRLLDALQWDVSLERFAGRQSSSAFDSAAVSRYREFRAKYFDMPKMRDAVATEYARLFSESELEEMVKFFESPAGRKYVETQLQIADVLQPMIAAVFKEHMEEYKRDVLGLPWTGDDVGRPEWSDP